jgi:hypothetical protein
VSRLVNKTAKVRAEIERPVVGKARSEPLALNSTSVAGRSTIHRRPYTVHKPCEHLARDWVFGESTATPCAEYTWDCNDVDCNPNIFPPLDHDSTQSIQ